MGNWHSAGGGLALYNNKIVFGLSLVTSSGNYTEIVSPDTIEANKWYTMVGTYDGANMKLYINGEEKVSGALTGNIKPALTFIALGGNPGIIGEMPGNSSYTTFSDALVFDRALTKEEVAKNYVDVPNPENKDELLVWYKFS